ncbi:MAG: hypothetical protein ACI8UP_001635 [Porticoccaceae bacterium]|jgi:uncharacterized protein (DUF1919 family)
MIRSASDKLGEKFKKLRVVANISTIKSRDFSIIASNCTGTLPYRFLNMPYTSPTVNLFFFAPCYLKFVKNLEYYLSLPLKFKSKSNYRQGELVRNTHGQYPVGQLDDIEIHFMHYASLSEATEKWNRRKQRINLDNLILFFTDKDLCTAELLREFDDLPFDNKLVLTAKTWPDIQSHIRVPHFDGMSEVGDCYTRYDHLTHINFPALIDSGVNDRDHESAELFRGKIHTPV